MKKKKSKISDAKTKSKPVATPKPKPKFKRRQPMLKMGGVPHAWLTPFKKGVITNPAGCPGGKRLLTEIIEHLEENDIHNPKITNRKAVAEAYVKAAKNGSFIHTKEIIDRQEGKISQKVEITDGSDKKLYIDMPLEGEEAP